MPAKRTFSDLRKSILECLKDGRKTVNDISTKTGINWKTVDNHLIYLCGKGHVAKVFDSPYVKIFELANHAPSQHPAAQHPPVQHGGTQHPTQLHPTVLHPHAERINAESPNPQSHRVPSPAVQRPTPSHVVTHHATRKKAAKVSRR